MRYVIARLEQDERDEAYRYYVSDSLQLVPQNKYKVHTLDEIYHPEKVKKQKTGDEIVMETMVGAGLTFR